MAHLFHTTGMVLSRRDWREADRVYSVLTSEYGKLECVAKGARKPLAKLAPHLESVSEAEFLIVRGRLYDTIAGVERGRAFPGLSANLSNALLAKHSLRLVDWGTRLAQPDAALYGCLTAWMAFVEPLPPMTPERSGFLLASFALRLLGWLGYRPEFVHCVQCHMTVVSGGFRWHPVRGGVVCQPCVEKAGEGSVSVRPLSDEALKFLRFALEQPPEQLLKLELRPDLVGTFHEAVEALVISHFPTIPPVSLRGACLV
ncbi:MAG TPA: DNA repair protein RecO [Patescibacteria group bacterium]|nr:DNA repair protein RecO [Patescibacteria group bacterium]